MKLVDQIRQMAPTHTQSEIVEALGINRRKLYDVANDHDLTFKRPTRGGAHDSHRSESMKARDAKLAGRIRALLEVGITRRQAYGKLAIANKTFERILEEHGIDYPKARRGNTSCAAQPEFTSADDKPGRASPPAELKRQAMDKSNAVLQKEKRAKEKALLDRIGADQRTLIVSKALNDDLRVLGERHGFEEQQETVSTFLISLTAAHTEDSDRFANMSRQKIAISENVSRR